MTQVVIQPSFGKPASRRRWRDTLAKPVPFGEPGLRQLLTEEQHARLLAMHPTGRARFWGATSIHDKNMDRLATGDVVLFTGQRHVRAVGEAHCPPASPISQPTGVITAWLVLYESELGSS